MKIKAAITPETGKSFEITDVELPEVDSEDVLIKVVTSGISHTDVSGRDSGMVERSYYKEAQCSASFLLKIRCLNYCVSPLTQVFYL